MKVILLQDIENLGKKFDIKEVSDGYARNFLISKGLAKPVTSSVLAEVEKLKEITIRKAEEELQAMQELVSQLDGQEIEIRAKAGEAGKFYAAINSQKIAAILKEKGLKIDKSQIKLKEPIKEAGEHDVVINFDHGLEAIIKLIVSEESEEKK